MRSVEKEPVAGSIGFAAAVTPWSKDGLVLPPEKKFTDELRSPASQPQMQRQRSLRRNIPPTAAEAEVAVVAAVQRARAVMRRPSVSFSDVMQVMEIAKGQPYLGAAPDVNASFMTVRLPSSTSSSPSHNHRKVEEEEEDDATPTCVLHLHTTGSVWYGCGRCARCVLLVPTAPCWLPLTLLCDLVLCPLLSLCHSPPPPRVLRDVPATHPPRQSR